MKTAKKVLSIVLAAMLVVGTLTVAASAYAPFPEDSEIALSLQAEVYDSLSDTAALIKDTGNETTYTELDEDGDAFYAIEDDFWGYEDYDHDVIYTSDDTIEVKPGQVVWVNCWATTTGEVYFNHIEQIVYYTNGFFLSSPTEVDQVLEVPVDGDTLFKTGSKGTNFSCAGSSWACILDSRRLNTMALTESESQTWHAVKNVFDATPTRANVLKAEIDEAYMSFPLWVDPDLAPGTEGTVVIGGRDIGRACKITGFPGSDPRVPLADTSLADTADAMNLEKAILHFKVVGDAPALDYQPLDAPIADYEEAELKGGEDLYTEETWTAATELYEQAVALKAAQDAADQDEIDDLADALAEAVENLEEIEVLDFSRLDNDVEKVCVAPLAADAYTTSSYEYYAECYAAAEDAQLNAATQQEIDDAADELEAAFAGLLQKADVSALEDALDQAAAADTSTWTQASKDALADAVSLGEAYMDMADDLAAEDSQEDIDDATQAILDALKNFEEEKEEEADYSAVEEAVDAAAKVNRDNYTAASLDDLDAAVAAVEYGLPESQQADVDAMAQAINDAIDALKELADTSRLERAIADADAANEADYAADTWAAIEEKVALGNTYIGAGLAADDVQGEIDALTDEINDLLAQMLGDADYSAVDAAINDMPDDFSNYTDESTQAVIDAYDAIVRGLKEDKQGDVDKMAADLAAAITGLTLKGADYEYVDKYVAQAANVDKALYTDDSLAALETALAAVVRDLDITHQDEVTGMANDLYAALEGLELKDADYTKVNEAKAKYPADTSIYTADSLQAVDDAIAAVVEGKKADEQDAVDAMAQAIEDAIAALKKLGADYDAVDAAIAKANGLTQKYYVDFSAVTAAINAVVRDLPVDQQDEIDAMAQAINDAIDALVMKDADYKAIDLVMKNVPSADKADQYTTASWENLMEKVDAVEYGLKVDRQADVTQWAKDINQAIKDLVKAGPADYSAVDAAIARADGIDADNYTNFRAVEDAIANVTTGLNANHQDEVDAMAQAINDAIDALEKQPANYDELDAAIAEAEDILDEIKDIEDWYINLDAFKDALADAKAVARDLKFDEQDTIDEALAALKTAEENVEMKPADYTALDEALAAAEKVDDTSAYTDDSVAAFEAALAAAQAVEKGLLIESQDEIDAAAQALKDAQAALELKPVVGDADYTAVDAAIADFNGKDQSIYTAASVQAVKDAIAAVVRGKTEDEQADVDAMAKAINDAIAALELLPPSTGVVSDVKYEETPSNTKDYDVTVDSRAWKIQFVDEAGNTRTFTRDSENVTITSYRADGTPCETDLDRALAYEVWHVEDLTLMPGTYTVISKDAETSWESLDNGKQVVVANSANDIDVKEVILDSTTIKRYTDFSFDVRTGKDVTKVKVLINGAEYKTFDSSCAEAVNGDLVYHVYCRTNGSGTSTLSVQSKSAEGWATNDKDVTLTVVK